MTYKIYTNIVKTLCETYHISAEIEHKFIHEFFEGGIPLFKLMLAKNDLDVPVTIVSFNLELDSAVAIQWYLRLNQLDENLMLSACYLKDTDGVSYVGEDAELLKQYRIEQEAISTYERSEYNGAEYLEAIKPQKVETAQYSSGVKKIYTDKNIALKSFHQISRQKDDKCH